MLRIINETFTLSEHCEFRLCITETASGYYAWLSHKDWQSNRVMALLLISTNSVSLWNVIWKSMKASTCKMQKRNKIRNEIKAERIQ